MGSFQHNRNNISTCLQCALQREHADAWVIWDGNAPQGQHDETVRVVVLTSPTEDSWNEFMKGSR